MDPLYSLLFGMALGFSLTVPPGPMNALIASESVVSVKKGIVTGAGAMSADLILGITVYLVRATARIGAYVWIVYILGTAVVAYLGADMLRSGKNRPAARAGGWTYAKALATGITNPFQILWWLTAGLAFAYLGGILLFAGLFAAIAVWIVAFPVALHEGIRRQGDLSRLVSVVSACLMFAFAAYFAYMAAVSV